MLRQIRPARKAPSSAGRALLAVLLAGAAACGPHAGPSSAPTQGQAAGGAIITAIAAGTLWIAAGGCRLQGCPYGSYCNSASGYCDVRRCDNGCPPGTVCNEGLGRCQAPPPPRTPNDFLPQDDKRRPPGSR